jgi:hypothetical protein
MRAAAARHPPALRVTCAPSRFLVGFVGRHRLVPLLAAVGLTQKDTPECWLCCKIPSPVDQLGLLTFAPLVCTFLWLTFGFFRGVFRAQWHPDGYAQSADAHKWAVLRVPLPNLVKAVSVATRPSTARDVGDDGVEDRRLRSERQLAPNQLWKVYYENGARRLAVRTLIPYNSSMLQMLPSCLVLVLLVSPYVAYCGLNVQLGCTCDGGECYVDQWTPPSPCVPRAEGIKGQQADLASVQLAWVAASATVIYIWTIPIVLSVMLLSAGKDIQLGGLGRSARVRRPRRTTAAPPPSGCRREGEPPTTRRQSAETRVRVMRDVRSRYGSCTRAAAARRGTATGRCARCLGPHAVPAPPSRIVADAAHPSVLLSCCRQLLMMWKRLVLLWSLWLVRFADLPLVQVTIALAVCVVSATFTMFAKPYAEHNNNRLAIALDLILALSVLICAVSVVGETLCTRGEVEPALLPHAGDFVMLWCAATAAPCPLRATLALILPWRVRSFRAASVCRRVSSACGRGVPFSPRSVCDRACLRCGGTGTTPRSKVLRQRLNPRRCTVVYRCL